jgi:hypothetical protein
MSASQRAAGANMSVDIQPGRAMLLGNYTTNEGSYYLFSDAVENVVISTAPGAGQSRIDVVVAQVRNQYVDTGSNSDFIFTTVVGTPATTGSQVAPALGTNQFAICNVLIGPNVTSIVNANLTDRRPILSTAAGGDLSGNLPNPTVARINGSPLGTTTGAASGQRLTWNGSSWVPAAPGGPPSGASGGDLAGTYPNPTVGMNLPAALASGAGFTTFTDSMGEIWVAKGGVKAGVWNKARDVLHGYYARSAALTTVTAANTAITFDAMQWDDYGLWSATPNPGFITLVAGFWRLTGQMAFAPTAASQWLNVALADSGFRKFNTQVASAGSAMPPVLYANGTVVVRAAANDFLQLWSWSSTASLAYSVGLAYTCFFQADYLGTG